MGKYHGDSFAKKIARANFWDYCLKGLPKGINSTFAVLASEECGDISTLSGMGVPEENIFAFDILESAINECKRRFPHVQTTHGCVSTLSKQVDCAFLDFCGGLTQKWVDIGLLVVNKVRIGGFFALGLMRGRDAGPLLTEGISFLKENSQNWKSLSSETTERRYRRFFQNPDPRIPVLVQTLFRKSRCYLRACIYYHSREDTKQGVPMGIFLCRKLSNDVQKIVSNEGLLIQKDKSDSEAKYYIATDPDSLAKGRDQAAIYNVDPLTLAAWKAHATRGTYDAAAE